MNPNVLLLIGRILLSIIFLISGFFKLMDHAGTVGYFAMVHLPVPEITAWVVGLFELLGGLAILVGFQVRIAGIALALFCLASGLVAHTNFGDQTQMIMFLKNLAMTGGYLALAAAGAGTYAIGAGKRVSAYS